MTKPVVPRERLASETDLLREAVNAYRAQKPATEPPQSPKPPKRRPSPAAALSIIPGWPLNPNPPAEVPDFLTMGTAAKHRQRKIGAQLPTSRWGRRS
jgi:hypothetical protein